MPYQFIRQAILHRCCASALYEDYIRVFCPGTLARTSTVPDVVEAFQYDGGHPAASRSVAHGAAFM